MYIKQIIIQGFKSYKDQTVIEPFSPKHNVIVGRNGSGKSNFFAAIRFVLSDAYTQMGREERQALLHEGSGSAVMSAYVEIVFDNSDDRFPTGKPELVLRRTIGQKKDEYSLDHKNATKSDVMNLLESAGFSRSNPYYIVPQGRVTTLTNMKDQERLTLLKEVAGTQVYEARRTESIRIMADTDAKRAKIDESLTNICQRLDELEEEKEELRVYQEKDRERRCLEYTIHHREQQKINKAIDQLEEQRANGLDESDAQQDRFERGEQRLSQIKEEIKVLEQRMELLKVDKKQYEDERRDVARQKAKIELDVKATADGLSAAQSARARYESDLDEVQTSIAQRENELSNLLPQYNSAKEREAALKLQLENAEGTRQRLFSKQGRSAKFTSKAQRDNWLRKEIDDRNVDIATRKGVSMQTNEEIAALEKNVSNIESQIANIRKVLESHGEIMDSVSAEIQTAKEARDKMQDQRKELWREEAKLDSVERNAQQEIDGAERALSNMMDHNTSRGLAAIRRIKRQQNLDGAYGTLAELFNIPDKYAMYRTAVEVTAGNSLFHYVVDNDQTASKLVEALNKDKLGRVTFMPLNRLTPKSVNMPGTSDAIPMIGKLDFEPKYEKAFRQVFGKTVICPNLSIAAQYAKSHGVSAITPDGDRSDKNGRLTGGYHDPKHSRMEAVQKVAKCRAHYDAQKDRREEIKRGIERQDQEVTRALSALQKAEQKRQQAESSYDASQQELRSKISEVQTKQDSLDSKRIAKTNIEAGIRELAAQQSSFEAELKSDFKKNLSNEEEQQLESLSNSIPDLRKQHSAESTTRTELESRKSTIEVELRENLRPMLDQLSARSYESGGSSASSTQKDQQKELKRTIKTLEGLDAKLRQAEASLDEANAERATLEQDRAEQRTQLEQIAKAIEKQQKQSEKSISERARLTAQAAEASKNIRDLGVLPEEAFDKKYTRITTDQADKRLRSVKTTLKKYSHVNKKAFEQYNSFTRQREALTQRCTELDTSKNSIRELIDVLDQRKDEAIERTFKQVSKEFASTFEKLVPAGRGRLIIQRKSDRDRERDRGVEPLDSDGEEDEAARDGVENYTGVGISVSFNSKHDEQQRIQQLSGGQKSLCALTLVFAIQQCDPAPFYLFDEIDANLDSQYRTAVAALLEQISEKGQFICTTFRPEMVHVAEKCYGVTYEHKTSSIHVVSREHALDFVDGQVGGM